MSDATCPRCGDTYDRGERGHFCLHPTDDGDPYARIATLEARIAELERVRDTAADMLIRRGADLDEAVRLLREALDGFDKQTSFNCWREDGVGDYVITARSAHEFVVGMRKLLLARHPAPDKETTK